jgi:tRNA threonylcarbamoyladenosine dehydratase
MRTERFARTERLVGAEGMGRLSAAHVTVVGLGAVGSYAVEALARAGVGHLRLVDFDVIRESNINRQLYALESTLGLPKVEVAAKRVHEINPACQVECLACFVHRESLDQVLAGATNMVLDAIDSLGPKVELIGAALARHLPLVSSMGAARRTDPLAVRLGLLSTIQSCRLASKVRKRLHHRGWSTDVLCVYSVEPILSASQSLVGSSLEGVPDFLQRGRDRRPMGSLPTITGIFGLVAAQAILSRILKPAPPACF